MIKTVKTVKVPTYLLQYYRIKKDYPEHIVLMRVGDFYETFGQDAETCSKVWGLNTYPIRCATSENGVDVVQCCGFPYAYVGDYIGKLTDAGHKVAKVDPADEGYDPRARAV